MCTNHCSYLLSFICSDWSEDLYYIVSAHKSNNGICYYYVRDTEGAVLKKTYYKQELNFVVRE